MAPPQQCLDVHHRASRQVDDRLVVQLELLVGERGLQLGLERRPLDRSDAHLGTEHAVAALAPSLDRIHDGVGVGDEILGLVAADSDAGAHLHAEVVAEDGEGPSQVLGDPGGDPHRLRLVGLLEEHPELVATEAGDGVLGTDAQQQALGHTRQQHVTGVVTEAVVDDLEVVEVQEEHGCGCAVPPPTGQGVRHPIGEQSAVGKPGEAVVRGLPPELLFQRLALADVAGVEHDAAHSGIVEQVADPDLGVAPCAVPCAQPALDEGGTAVVQGAAVEQAVEDRSVVGVDPRGQ